MRFSDGAFFEIVLPLLREWYSNLIETVIINNLGVDEREAGLGNTNKVSKGCFAILLVHASHLIAATRAEGGLVYRYKMINCGLALKRTIYISNKYRKQFFFY